MKPDQELDLDLERLVAGLRRQGSIVGRVMHLIEEKPRPLSVSANAQWSKRRRHILWWGVAVAAAAIIALVIHSWPAETTDGLAWADVIRQIEAANTAHIRWTASSEKGADKRRPAYDIYCKRPYKRRCEYPSPGELGKQIIITNGTREAVLYPAKKRCQIKDDYMGHGGEAAAELDRLSNPVKPGILLPQWRSYLHFDLQHDRLVSEGIHDKDGRKLHRYRLEKGTPSTRPSTVPVNDAPRSQDDARSPSTQPSAAPSSPVVCFWSNPANDRLACITIATTDIVDGSDLDVSYNIDIDVDLPDDLFSVEVPPGYVNMPLVELSEQMAPEIRDLLAKYYRIRCPADRYRAVIWEEVSGRKGEYSRHIARSLRDESNWRVDEGWDRAPAASDFDTLWGQFKPARNGGTLMTYKGEVAGILRTIDKTQQDGLKVACYRGPHPGLTRCLPENLIWPGFGFLDPRGEFDYVFDLLPASPEQPRLVGLRVACLAKPERYWTPNPSPPTQPSSLLYLWLDPDKDYLCVRYVQHQRMRPVWDRQIMWSPSEPSTTSRDSGGPFKSYEPGPGGFVEYDQTREVIEFGRTPEGRWYPKTIRWQNAWLEHGTRRIYPERLVHIELDTAGPIPQDLLEWPEKVTPDPNSGYMD